MNNLSYQELLDAEARAAANRRRPLRLAVLFLLFFCSLALVWDKAGGTVVERFIIHDLTVRPTAWVVQRLWPDHAVIAQAHSLVSPKGRLNVLVGCDGLETLFLLVAAFLAYPFTWRVRLQGLILGAALLFCLNQARIVCLWHAWIADRALFEALHGFVLPILLISFVFIYFLLYLVRYDAR